MFKLRKVLGDDIALIPGKGDVYEAVPTNAGGIIDVITELDISATPMTQYLSNKLPHIVLFEYDVEYNSTLASALYYTRGSFHGTGVNEGVKALGSELQTFAGDMLKNVKDDTITKSFSDKIKSGAAFTAKSLGDSLSEISKASNEFTDPVMTPYNGLYLRKKTGFTYILPNFDNKKRSISTQYSTTDESLAGKSGINEIVGSMKNVAEKVVGFLATASPGAFIETPQFYAMPGGDTLQITFDLINTLDSLAYQKNYDFLFLLTFQNTPYRKDLARIIPPKMYKCFIPGEQQIPYCYISSMDIQFVGNRRMLKVKHPLTGSLTEAIIPDAYVVTITIQSLNPSSGNFMLAAANVTVS